MAKAKRKRARSKVAPARCARCAICSQLKDEEYAFQKYGWEEENTYLPAAANRLNLVKDLKPPSSRDRHLMQCPECRTYYLYRTDYEFLVNGTKSS